MVGLYQILAGNVITCLEPLLNYQCHTGFERLGLCLAVTEIKQPLEATMHSQKSYMQKQDLKNIKDVGIAYTNKVGMIQY